LVQRTDGNFYITTGGALYGDGTLTKVTPSGAQTQLILFNGAKGDGQGPSTLIVGSDGNLYGTTAYGGGSGFGTIFKICLSCTPTARPAVAQNLSTTFNGANVQLTWSAAARATAYEIMVSHSINGDGAEPIESVPGTSVTVSTHYLLTKLQQLLTFKAGQTVYLFVVSTNHSGGGPLSAASEGFAL
jgi:uncharacterized repeat protein (TIGR03803 family)